MMTANTPDPKGKVIPTGKPDDVKTNAKAAVPAKRGSGRPKKESSTEEKKFVRVPFGGMRKRLSVSNKDPAYHYGWFRDEGDNYIRLRRGGYSEVSFREAERECPQKLTGTSTSERLRPEDACRTHGGVGEGGVAYQMILMKIPMEFYLEDCKTGEARAEAIDEAIYRPEFKDGKVINNTYGEINVSVRDKE